MAQRINLYVTVDNMVKGETFTIQMKPGQDFQSIPKPQYGVEVAFWTKVIQSNKELRIVLPNPWDDDTLFYAAFAEAEDDKIWCEELHSFVTIQWKSQFDSGCFDTDNPEDTAKFWAEAVENVRKDIFGENPVTGEEGQAIVCDPYLANLCEENGYDVLPCTKEDPELGMIDYWLIFPVGGEDEYFEMKDSEESDPRFYSDFSTHEECFEGEVIHSYWDMDHDPEIGEDETLHKCSFFVLRGGYSTYYTTQYILPYDKWEGLCRIIEENPAKFFLEKYDGGGIIAVDLDDLGYPTHYIEVNGDVLPIEEDDDFNEVVCFKESGE